MGIHDTDELARGGSSIVYNAYYIDNLGARKTVRIKECYPFRYNLHRLSDGSLLISEAERKLFLQTTQKMRRAYQLGNEFFAADGLTNLTANTYNIYEANHTLYVVSVYAQGQELSYERYSSVKDSIAAVKSAAVAISKIHNKAVLYLDIKPSNILTLECTTELIQLFDFDTVVPISDIPELGDKISFTKGLRRRNCNGATENESERTRMCMGSAHCCFICSLIAYRMPLTVIAMPGMIFQSPSSPAASTGMH